MNHSYAEYFFGISLGSLRDLRERVTICRLCHLISPSLLEGLLHGVEYSDERMEILIARKSSYAATFTAMCRYVLNPHARSTRDYLAVAFNRREPGDQLDSIGRRFSVHRGVFGRMLVDC